MVINFATQSYKSRSLPLSAQRVVNFYAEKEPQDAKSPIAMFGAPGLTQFADVGQAPVRGMHVMAGILYVVAGGTLFSVSRTGNPVTLGVGILGSSVVSMADNGFQLIIVNGIAGYLYSTVAGFVTINSPNFFPSDTVTFFDQYFVFDRKGTNQFFISGILNGLTYNGLDFASAEVEPDNVLATINQQENLLIFGQKTIETWFDSGAANFPFQRVDGATIQRGCAAAKTPIKEDNAVFFVGDDLIFYRLDGIFIRRVSTHAVEHAWQQYTTTSDAFTFAYTYEGHKFIVLTFPSQDATWVFDISTNLWHERESWDSSNRNLTRWRGNCFATAYNKLLIGDQFTGLIGAIDGNTYTEFGNTIRGLLSGPPIHSDRKRVFISRFELDVEQGVGLTTGQGSDPQIMLNWSKDGGRTFSDLQIWNTAGKIGEYNTRLRWLRLGQARQWIFQVTVSDPVKRSIISAHADMEAGM